jgi:DNA segregation ATPase FtsK/SpoIIIE-like protein
VARIAAVGRAAGIHLRLASQRPERTIVASLSKQNLPMQVCFKVANATNTQIVLCEAGAESLYGKGDRLCDFGKGLVRAQGLFIPQADYLRVLTAVPAEARIHRRPRPMDMDVDARLGPVSCSPEASVSCGSWSFRDGRTNLPACMSWLICLPLRTERSALLIS